MASRHRSPAESMVEQRTLLPQAMFLDWRLERILLDTGGCRQLLILARKTELGGPLFQTDEHTCLNI
jgi:hypothetical protein